MRCLRKHDWDYTPPLIPEGHGTGPTDDHELGCASLQLACQMKTYPAQLCHSRPSSAPTDTRRFTTAPALMGEGVSNGGIAGPLRIRSTSPKLQPPTRHTSGRARAPAAPRPSLLEGRRCVRGRNRGASLHSVNVTEIPSPKFLPSGTDDAEGWEMELTTGGVPGGVLGGVREVGRRPEPCLNSINVTRIVPGKAAVAPSRASIRSTSPEFPRRFTTAPALMGEGVSKGGIAGPLRIRSTSPDSNATLQMHSG
jgi:hypothetical protein